MSARKPKETKGGKPPADFPDDAPTSIYDSDSNAQTQEEIVIPSSATAPTKAERVQKIVTISMKTPADPQLKPIVAISMKTPADPNAKPIAVPDRDLPHVRLRAMSEISRRQQPQNHGNIAPPYDARAAAAKNVKEYALWGCLAVVIACGIALVVWFVAT